MFRWLGQLLISLLTFSVPTIAVVPTATPVASSVLQAPSVVSENVATPVEAKGAAVVDFRSGTVLYEQQGATRYPLASITKLMTALVLLDGNLDWQALVTVQPSDQRAGGRVLLKSGEQVSVEDLFNVMLIASSNEAAVALSRFSGLPQPAFVAAMNRKAENLGLSTMRFVDVAGLEAGNVGSATDVARLARAALDNPKIHAAVIRSEYPIAIRNTGERRVARSTDELLLDLPLDSDFRLVGGKTGYLDEVGYNYVAMFEAGGNRVSLVLLGSPTAEVRWRESLRLTRWIFSRYRWPALGG